MYLIAFIVFYKHIPNIIRLVKGEEKKVVWK
jgi:glycerol-3-phosphate acyltransferase PlsY